MATFPQTNMPYWSVSIGSVDVTAFLKKYIVEIEKKIGKPTFYNKVTSEFIIKHLQS